MQKPDEAGEEINPLLSIVVSVLSAALAYLALLLAPRGGSAQVPGEGTRAKHDEESVGY